MCRTAFLLIALLPVFAPTRQDSTCGGSASCSNSLFTCQAGWKQLEDSCYKVFTTRHSWTKAEQICESYSAILAKANGGLAQSKALARFVREEVVTLPAADDDDDDDEEDRQDNSTFWIGFNCGISLEQCYWADRQKANSLYGQWKTGQPDINTGQCASINMSSLEDPAWSLNLCMSDRMFICQAIACLSTQFLCGDRCIPKRWVCDRMKDCEDGSDEQDCETCDHGIQTGTSGKMVTPNYPNKYPNYAKCSWKIETNEKSKVQIQVVFFETEKSYDFVKIYDGLSKKPAQLIAELSGRLHSGTTLTSRTNRALVVFESDYTEREKGFHLNWTAVPDRCGADLIATYDTGFFSSPGFPRGYDNFTECKWTIKSKFRHQLITIQFEHFNVSGPLDRTLLYDGKTSLHTFIGEFNGSTAPRAVITTRRYAFFKFEAGQPTYGTGFNVTYRAGCTLNISQSFGRISSPGFGIRRYPKNVKCSWLITEPKGRPLALIFHKFLTEEAYDVVSIYEGSSANHLKSLGHFSGAAKPSKLRSPSGRFFVTFSSDRYVRMRGWSATFSKDCPSWYPLSDHVRLTSDDVSYGAKVRYHCDPGYTRKNKPSRQCLFGGVWSRPQQPECIPTKCPMPTRLLVPNAVLSEVSGSKIGDRIKFTCRRGYRHVNNSVATCRLIGSNVLWDELPRCQVVTCEHFVDLENGRVTYTENIDQPVYGTKVVVRCKLGYTLQGLALRHCTQHGNWSIGKPKCIATSCVSPMSIANGERVSAALTPMGEELIVRCASGYQLRKRIYCLRSGVYDTKIHCDDIDECNNSPCAPHTCQNEPGGYICRCLPGYKHKNNNFKKCEDIDECKTNMHGCDGSCKNIPGGYTCLCPVGYRLFSGVPPTQNLVTNQSCVPVTCPSISVDKGIVFWSASKRADQRFRFGVTLYVMCKARHVLQGSARRTCLETGKWSGDRSVCRIGKCKDPEPLNHGRLTFSDGLLASSVVTYTCSKGYNLIGRSQRTCLLQSYVDMSTYTWSHTAPFCQKLNCGWPREVPHGRFEGNGTDLGCMMTLRCDDDFELVGTATRVCGVDGLWIGEAACKHATCVHPGKPEHGQLIGNSSIFTAGMSVRFECTSPGYNLSDTRPLKCIQGSIDDVNTTPVINKMTTPSPGRGGGGGRDIQHSGSSSSVHLASCCARRGVKADCLGACDLTDSILRRTLLTLPICLNELTKILLCFADDRDHVRCCRQVGVTTSCQSICRGDVTGMTQTQWTDCVPYLNAITDCMDDGRSTIPTSPRAIQGTVTCESLKVQWYLPEPATEMVRFYVVQWTCGPETGIKTVGHQRRSLSVPVDKIRKSCRVTIRAANRNQEYSLPSKTITISGRGCSPSRPRDFRAEVVNGEVKLRWSTRGKSVQAAVSYRLRVICDQMDSPVVKSLTANVFNISDENTTSWMPLDSKWGDSWCNMSLQAINPYGESYRANIQLNISNAYNTRDIDVPASGKWCYSCEGASTNEECNEGGLVKCESDQEFCETEVRYINQVASITKRCREQSECLKRLENNVNNCPGLSYLPVCIYCCYGHSCNKQAKTDLYDDFKRRKRRSTAEEGMPRISGQRRTYWNRPLPLCIDKAPPVFLSCPSDITLPMVEDGSAVVNFDIPVATDNSGLPIVIATWPRSLRPPYTVYENSTFIYTAIDVAGNTAECSFSVHLRDVTPPKLVCPIQVSFSYHNTSNITVPSRYPHINVTDIGGMTSVKFDPPEGELVFLHTPIKVRVIAIDTSGNVANCSFAYQAESCYDPLYDQIGEANHTGNMPMLGLQLDNCQPIYDTDDTCQSVSLYSGEWNECGDSPGGMTGYACSVSCPGSTDTTGLVSNSTVYVCRIGGAWFPNNWIAECTDKLFPDYFLVLNEALAWDSECGAPKANFIDSEIVSRTMAMPCNRFSRNYHGSLSVKNKTTTTGYDIKVTFLLTIRDMHGINPTQIRWCMRQLKVAIYRNILITAMRSPSGNLCSNLTFGDMSSREGFCCPHGHVLKHDFCLKCPSGTHHNRSADSCLPCPVGFYQDEPGQLACLPCPEGLSTDSEYTKNITQCRSRCRPGEYSTSGVVPCNTCPIGQYQPRYGAVTCMSCPELRNTSGVGAVNLTDCKGICQPGTYGNHGLAPCVPCPRNHYQEEAAGSACKECGPDEVTEQEGSDSQTMCIVMDWCSSSPCFNNATCYNNGRFFGCDCLDGYAEEHCEIDIDECEAFPCANNGSCVDDIANYTCICQQGYEGRDCSEEVDPCEDHQCVKGVCVPDELSYKCECFSGWEGTFCNEDIDDCVTNPCQNNATCTDLLDAFKCNCSGTGFEGTTCTMPVYICDTEPCYNDATCTGDAFTFTCHCSIGYTGDRCETQIDNCQSEPCQNEARCTNNFTKIEGFECDCRDGFEGVTCELDIDECASDPCLNSANCTDQVNGFVCTCALGFSGAFCQTNIDDCLPMPCMNHVACVDLVNDFRCKCTPGFAGKRCEVDIDECSSSPCQSGGTCMDQRNSFSCLCVPGYTGDICQVDIDDCVPQPCHNMAQCIDRVAGFECQCQPGWTGPTCDTDIDDCQSVPCQNGATCSDLLNGYSCRCTDIWEGTNCESLIDNCIAMPCANHATCVNLPGNYSCTCKKGYAGRHCEIDIDECASFPCQNNATCRDRRGSFQCNCLEEYYGVFCESKIDKCLVNNTCQNGATCVDEWLTKTCVCTPKYTGINCEKDVSPKFDLLFNDVDAAIEKVAFSVSSDFRMEDLESFSLCFWLRHAGTSGNGSYLVLSHGEKQWLVFKESSIHVSLFDDISPVDIPVTVFIRGEWGHCCFMWDSAGGTWTLYVNGKQITRTQGYGMDRKLTANLSLVLGTPSSSDAISKKFVGELSRVNVYSRTLDADVISVIATSCGNESDAGDLKSWVEYKVTVPVDRTDIIIRGPSICGSSECPPGFRGTYCQIRIDRMPPKVLFCPNTTRIINNSSRHLVVNWTDPVFEDDVGITDIHSTHRPGQLLEYGQYLVTYVASDAAGNSATCKFKLFVLHNDCPYLAPPAHGVASYGYWTGGQMMVVKCIFPYTAVPNNWMFTCVVNSWYRPTYTQCVDERPPEAAVAGSISAEAASPCTDNLKQTVINLLVDTVKRYSKLAAHLCADTCTDFDHVKAYCGPENTEKRRRKREITSVVDVTFTIPVNSSASLNPAAELSSTLKTNLPQTEDLKVTVNEIEDIILCPSGYVPDDTASTCVACARGTVYNAESKTCMKCPVGSFSNQSASLSCDVCPNDWTTEIEGSQSADDCYVICDAGYFWDSKQCTACKLGYYQDSSGQRSCKACPATATTLTVGSTRRSHCNVTCGLGEEMTVAETCSPCAKGTYRDTLTTLSCTLCQYGFTTDTTGATSADLCNRVECPRGSYTHPHGACEQCARASYQPEPGQTSCHLCPRGTTTSVAGAVAAWQCVTGTMDRCATGAHDCEDTAVCRVAEDWFVCDCEQGLIADGTGCREPYVVSAVAAYIATGVAVVLLIGVIVIAIYYRLRCSAREKASTIMSSELDFHYGALVTRFTSNTRHGPYTTRLQICSDDDVTSSTSLSITSYKETGRLS